MFIGHKGERLLEDMNITILFQNGNHTTVPKHSN